MIFALENPTKINSCYGRKTLELNVTLRGRKGELMSEKKKSNSAKFKILAIAFGVAIPFVIALLLELISYLAIASIYPDDLLLFKHCLSSTSKKIYKQDHRGKILTRPEIPFKHLRGWGYTRKNTFWGLNIDKSGFISTNNRKDIVPKAKEANETRIVLIGGSSVAGTGATANDKTIASFLENKLQSDRKNNVRVINAGVGGYYSPLQYSYLAHELLPDYQPDLIIVLDGYNDARRSYMDETDYFGATFTRQEKDINKFLSGKYSALQLFLSKHPINEPKKYYTTFLLDLLANGSKIENPAVKFDIPLTKVMEMPIKGFSKDKINTQSYLYYRDLTIFAAQLTHTKIIYALQPSVVYKENLTEPEEALLAQLEYNARSGSDPYSDDSAILQIKGFFEIVRKSFQNTDEQIASEGVRLLDLSDLFKTDKEDVFYDYVHYTDLGNKKIADELAAEVQEFLPEQR